MKVARPVREGGPGKRARGNSDTAPGADPHWLHGGTTDLDNLVLLCAFHHRLLHDRGYRIRWEQGRWVFARPDGTPIPETGPPLDGNTESLIEINTRAELRITRDSLTPTWAGERLDPVPILARLLPRRTPAAA